MEPTNKPFSTPPLSDAPFSLGTVPIEYIHFAGFGVRLAAYIIDCLIILGLTIAIWGLESSGSWTNGKLDLHIFQGNSTAATIFSYGYFLVFWTLLSSSPGKMLLRIKIVDAQGQKISTKNAVVRTLSYFLLIIGAWFILTNEHKRALHDQFAGTYVIYKS